MKRNKLHIHRFIEQPKLWMLHTLWNGLDKLYTFVGVVVVDFFRSSPICCAYKVLYFFICLVSFAVLTHSNDSMNVYIWMSYWAIRAHRTWQTNVQEPHRMRRREMRGRETERAESVNIECVTNTTNALHIRFAITQRERERDRNSIQMLCMHCTQQPCMDFG